MNKDYEDREINTQRKWRLYICSRGCPYVSNLGPVLLISRCASSMSSISPPVEHGEQVCIYPSLSDEFIEISLLARIEVIGFADPEADGDEKSGKVTRGGWWPYCRCPRADADNGPSLLLPLALLVASTSFRPSVLSPDARVESPIEDEWRRKKVLDMAMQLSALGSVEARILPVEAARMSP